QTRVVFSKRDGQVRAVLEAVGVSYGDASRPAKKGASAESRQARERDVADVDLRADWHRQIDNAAAEGGFGQVLAEQCRHGRAVLPERPSAAEIAAWIWRDEYGLIAHAKVVTRADVLAAVIDACPDGIEDLAEAEALTDEALQYGPAVRLPASGASHLSNSDRYTSEDILQAERTLLQITRERYDQQVAVVDPDVARLAIDTYEVSHDLTFSAEQRRVLERLLSAGHGVDAVIGVAGSGKTTMMAAARTAWEGQGMVVAGAATAAVAAANLQAEAGIPSSTIATWLLRIEGGRGLSGVDVLVVDEASMVDDRQMAALLAESARTGTKIVPIGDPLQLRAAGVGGGFAAIHRQVAGPEPPSA
uniref:AAA family ATPase n=1 Tax=Nonomuraea sp. bgisy094 TaxID=3413781 RepID=UPI003EC0A858